MEKSPLQIYFSALVFAPSTSPIRNRFNHVPMQWMTKLPTIRTHWSSLQQTLECNPDPVLYITFSPDGTVLASTSGYKVRLWDPSSGQRLNTLGQDKPQTLDNEVDERDFSNGFSTIVFSPNGKTLASASPGIIKVWLWDVLTGQCLQTLHGHTRAVNQLAFSYNGDILASSSYDKTVRLWDPCTGNCLQILTGHTDCVRAVAFSPAPRFANILASVSDDDSIRIWDSTTAKCLQDIKTNDEEIRVLAFSCDGEILASAYGDKSNIHHSDASKIQLWNPITGQSLHILQGHSDKVTAIAFSPNGKILASASWDNSVRLWDPLDGHCLAILQHYAHVYDIAFAPDGKTLASSTSHNNSVWLWDPLTRQCLQTLEGHSSWVHSVAFSPSLNNSEKLLASAALDDKVILWSTSAEQDQEIAPNESDILRYFSPLPGGKKLVLLNDKTIQIWDLSTGQRLQTVDYHKILTSWISISPDGEKIVLITSGNQILMWNPSNGERLQTVSAHAIKSSHFSPNGEKIVLLTSDNQILMWNPSNGERLQTASTHAIKSCHFSPNGEKIVLITGNSQILVWNPSNGKSLQSLNAHQSWIQAATFSPGGDKFASLSVDSMLQICDMSTGRCLQILQTSVSNKYHGYGLAITFCPDGLYVASSSGETAQLWDVSTGKCLQTLEGHITAISVMAFPTMAGYWRQHQVIPTGIGYTRDLMQITTLCGFGILSLDSAYTFSMTPLA
jgi:WD40 repeat protein